MQTPTQDRQSRRPTFINTVCATRLGLLMAGTMSLPAAWCADAAPLPAPLREAAAPAERAAQAEANAGAGAVVPGAAEAPPAASSATSRAPAESAPPAAPPAARPASKAAGAFEIDEEAAQRALERTLTQSGALLLQAGTIEFSPGFQYARVEQSSPILLSFPATPSAPALTSIAENRVRRNEFALRGDFRIGLPMNAQAEIGLPFTHITAQQNNTFDPVNSSSGSGIGDITLGIAKSIMREKGALPDLIGRVTYNTGSGKNLAPPLGTGAGFHQLQAELVAVKRQDPLAFVASIAYGKVFEKDGVKPGDTAVLSLSALLAASPATSLQMGFSQVLRARQELRGTRVSGSDQTYGVVSLGASSILSRDMTLVTQFGIGVGSDAPKYTIGIFLPILFR